MGIARRWVIEGFLVWVLYIVTIFAVVQLYGAEVSVTPRSKDMKRMKERDLMPPLLSLHGLVGLSDPSNDSSLPPVSGQTMKEEWIADPGTGLGEFVAFDSLGNIYLDIDRGRVVKYNKDGQEVWNTSVLKDGRGLRGETQIHIDEFDNILYTRSISTAEDDIYEGNNYYFVKLNGEGRRLWDSQYNNASTNCHDDLSSSALDSAGNLVVTGRSWEGNSIDLDNAVIGAATVKLDNLTGQKTWVARFDVPGTVDGALWIFQGGQDLVIDPEGNIYVTGSIVWDRGTTTAVTIDPVTGESHYHDDMDIFVVKYNSEGVELRRAFFDNPQNGLDYVDHQRGKVIAVAPSGNVYIAGASGRDTGASMDFSLIALDSDLNFRWNRIRDGAGVSLEDAGPILAVDEEENIYLSGVSLAANSQIDLLIFKFDSMGNETGRDLYATPKWEWGEIILADHNGKVHIAGGGIGGDYTLLSYLSSGDIFRRYDVNIFNGSNNNTDIAKHAAVDDEGNVVITGWSSTKADDETSESESHAVTIKYSPSVDFALSLSVKVKQESRGEGEELRLIKGWPIMVEASLTTGKSLQSGLPLDILEEGSFSARLIKSNGEEIILTEEKVEFNHSTFSYQTEKDDPTGLYTIRVRAQMVDSRWSDWFEEKELVFEVVGRSRRRD